MKVMHVEDGVMMLTLVVSLVGKSLVLVLPEHLGLRFELSL